MKQTARVFDAITAGALTSLEAATLTGLSVKRCSSVLSALLDMGLVRKTGRWVHAHTRRAYCYESVQERR